MTDIQKDIEARQLLRDVAEEARAMDILKKPVRPHLLPSLLVNAIAIYVLLTGLEASVWVKGLLVGTCGAAVASAWEVWHLSRRLEALTTLVLRRGR